jgi:hypothetical protein
MAEDPVLQQLKRIEALDRLWRTVLDTRGDGQVLRHFRVVRYSGCH